jgi:hypothetical protein
MKGANVYKSDTWVEVAEFPEYYVNPLGKVIKNGRIRAIASFASSVGELYIPIYSNGEQFNRSVAKLVAKAFLDPPLDPSFDTPIHLDGDRTNNRFDNLMWRPRWFALRFHKQFESWSHRKTDMLVRVVETNEHITAREAAMKYGVLASSVMLAAMTNDLAKKRVWPTRWTFDRLYTKTYMMQQRLQGL